MAKQNWKPGNMLYPVPAVMVSCGREGERPNIITVAWSGTICSSPAMLSIAVRPERYSYDIIKETKEFVVNLVTRDTVYAADYCGVKSGRDVDKYKEMNLTPSPSSVVKAPGIAECPVSLECRVVEIKPLGSHDLFLAEIVNVSVDERYLDEKGKFHLNSARLVAYSHGEYFELGEKLGSFGYSVKKGAAGSRKGKNTVKAEGGPQKDRDTMKGAAGPQKVRDTVKGAAGTQKVRDTMKAAAGPQKEKNTVKATADPKREKNTVKATAGPKRERNTVKATAGSPKGRNTVNAAVRRKK